jgi:uncharacterized RDD family membrane protein YckC
VSEGLAGDGTKRRVFAMGVDNLLALFLGALCGAHAPVVSPEAKGTVSVVIYLGYYFLQEGALGATLGKLLFGLRVLRLDGTRAAWREAGLRTLLRVLEVNPLVFGVLPGGLIVAFSKRKQRLGDMLARTVVVRKPTDHHAATMATEA